MTVVTKSNSLRHGLVMWDEIAAEVGKDFSDVKVDKMLVDAMTVCVVFPMLMIRNQTHWKTGSNGK